MRRAVITTPGETFVDALARRDRATLLKVMAPEIDFRGMTPSKSWDESDATAVVDNVLSQWLEPQDVVEAVLRVETDSMLDRQRVGYRFLVSCPDGKHHVEQQAYYSVDSQGRINWMRVLCSGFRPLGHAGNG